MFMKWINKMYQSQTWTDLLLTTVLSHMLSEEKLKGQRKRWLRMEKEVGRLGKNYSVYDWNVGDGANYRKPYINPVNLIIQKNIQVNILIILTLFWRNLFSLVLLFLLP